MNLMRGIQLKKIALQMNGASGAESKAVCTEAGMFALRERRQHVTEDDFQMAVSKVSPGKSLDPHMRHCRFITYITQRPTTSRHYRLMCSHVL